MSEVLEQIKQRQSDRISFDEARRVSEVDLRKILEAGSWAPTAHNMQNFEVIVVDDKKVLKRDCGHSSPHLGGVRQRELQAAFLLRGGADEEEGRAPGRHVPPVHENSGR